MFVAVYFGCQLGHTCLAAMVLNKFFLIVGARLRLIRGVVDDGKRNGACGMQMYVCSSRSFNQTKVSEGSLTQTKLSEIILVNW